MRARAYLAGCLHGDAWLGDALCLKVADLDFAEAFRAAVTEAFAVPCGVRRCDRGYWLVTKFNGFGRFNDLKAHKPADTEEKGAWLRGLFDSEGNVQLTLLKRGQASYSRRVAMFSTEVSTLERARAYLRDLGIEATIGATKNSASHKGSKVVFVLRVLSSKTQYSTFAEKVGSSIGRKAAGLTNLVASYAEDRSAACRRGQLLGVAARRRNAAARLAAGDTA